jgi:mannose-6-phosphate isomerase-like protein (cupin superfamily)
MRWRAASAARGAHVRIARLGHGPLEAVGERSRRSDHEDRKVRLEIFVALSGGAVATFADSHDRVDAGGALIVPAGREFVISNPGPGAFEAVVILPAGARATVDGTEAVPPWAA